MRITPVNAFNNSVVNNNQNSQRYSSPVMKNQLCVDTVQFKGRMFIGADAVKIADSLEPLRNFMAETRPLYVKVLNLKKNAAELLNKTDKEKAAAIMKSADHYMNLIPYKKATTIASEADAHIARINEAKLMDLPEQEKWVLQNKTRELSEKIDSLEQDKQNYPLISKEVKNFLEENKNLVGRLFS